MSTDFRVISIFSFFVFSVVLVFYCQLGDGHRVAYLAELVDAVNSKFISLWNVGSSPIVGIWFLKTICGGLDAPGLDAPILDEFIFRNL